MKRRAAANAKDGPLRCHPDLAVEVDDAGWPPEVVWHVGFAATDAYLYRLVTPPQQANPPVYEFVKPIDNRRFGQGELT